MSENEIPEVTTAPPAPAGEKKPLTRDEAVAQILARQTAEYDKNDYAERLAIANRKNLKLVEDPSIEPTLEELKAAVPLKRDRLNYDWKNDKKGTAGVLAVNCHGLFSIPKQRGRRKTHMTKRAQSIKSTALRIFKQLMDEKAERLKAVCAKEGFEYLGIPDSAVPELAKRAGMLATKEYFEKKHRKTQKALRRQKFSRAVNAGTTTTSEKRFVESGGQFGN